MNPLNHLNNDDKTPNAPAIINNINKNKNLSMHHHYNYNHYYNNNNAATILNNNNKLMHTTKHHHDTTNVLAAKLFASRGFRRRSYDDQEGDNDINIILQPSDLDDIEKTARAKYAQFKASLQCSSNGGKITNTINEETTTTLAASDARLSWLDFTGNEGGDPKATLTTLSPSTTIADNQNRSDRAKAKKLKALNNIFQDIKLAKCLLDQDYNQTVRLFIKKSALNWNFNSFTFDALCCGRSLTELLLHLFDYYNLYNIFDLDILKVLKCFRLLEFGYHSTNPYHNSVHAADVTQAMHCFIQENKIRKHMTDLEILCSILAAVCHDLDHPGVNQSFLVATNNPLVGLYQNNSVLENHHWRFALCIFRESHIFDHFEQTILDDMKEQLKHLILATDIARQNEYLLRFRDLTSSDEFSMSNTEDRALVLQMALKCADLGNPCRPWLISRVWSNLICDEFYRMGQIERRLGVPLTPICQREKTSIAGIQTDFFRFIVLPLLELWHNFLESPLSNLLMSNFDHNYKRWQRANRIVQQLRRRKSVACLEPVEDSCERDGSCLDDSPTHLNATTQISNNDDSTQKLNGGGQSTFFDPTMETFCSKHSFVAIKRASSDYIKSGNGRLELLRDFQLNRIIEKSPLMRRSCKFNARGTSAMPAASAKTTVMEKEPPIACDLGVTCCSDGGCHVKTARPPTPTECDDKKSCSAQSAATKCSPLSSISSSSSSSQVREQLPVVFSVSNQQQQYRKVLSPIQDGGESGASPELAASAQSSTIHPAASVADKRNDSLSGTEISCGKHLDFLHQHEIDDQEESASCSTPASRASSTSSSPVMQRSVSSRTSLAQEHHLRKTPQQHIKQLYEPSSGSKVKLTQTSSTRFSMSHPKSLYNSKRRESDPGCPSDSYELAAALVLLQYQNNTLFHKRRSSLPVCVPSRRSSK